jgi:hypothetical protein
MTTANPDALHDLLPQGDPDWGRLQRVQERLVAMGYTFHVTPTHHTVYRFEHPLFGVRNLTSAEEATALFAHWGSAINSAIVHARLFRDQRPAPELAID